jgi:agmatine/peptidylarginine deiminase
VPTNDTWIRDYGPVGILDESGIVFYNYQFNGWGNKYPAEMDNGVMDRLYAEAGLFSHRLRMVQRPDFVLEGGSIDTNGDGVLLTTERCLLSGTRNPDRTREQIEKQLKSDLGVHTIIWLKSGYLSGDDTDGHIDTLARFCDRQTIAYVRCNEKSHPDYGELLEMEGQLRHTVRSILRGFRLVPLPTPELVVDDRGHPLPATYANFLVINGAVLVPTYGCASDCEAMETIGGLFPDRELIGIDARILIKQGGSIHCATMQLPKGSIL